MKRLIATVTFAMLAVPAFAERGAPYERTEFDRTLPQLNLPAPQAVRVDAASLPYEKTQFDRGLPVLPGESVRFAALGGASMNDAAAEESAGSPWAQDHNFIAPAP